MSSNFDRCVSNKIEKNDFDSIMVSGDGKPVNFDVEIKFDEKIEKAMKMEKFSSLAALQKGLWWTVLRGRNVICISPYSSGKTLGYVLPILNLLLTSRRNGHESNFELENEEYGPIALILVPSWKTAELVARFCRLIVKDLHIAVLYGSGDEREQYPLLLNGCPVVVATPPAFLRAVDEYTFTNLNRLKHFILDDVDILLETYPDQLQKILKEINLNLAQRTLSTKRTMQIIACGKQWTDGVERFYGELKCFRPIVFVHPWLEASVFARISTKIVVLKHSEKNKRLLQYLKSLEASSSSIVAICVANLKTAEEIRKFLNEENIFISSQRVTDAARDRQCVLCVDDRSLLSSSINDVDVLIHYDLGECDHKGKTLFERRWILMRQHFTNDRRKDSNLRQILFIAETNAVQSPDVERYLKRLNAPVPKKLTQLIAGRISVLHQERERFHLCPYLKCFGRCTNEITCKYRHKLMEFDRRAMFLPKNGEEIFVTISRIISAQRFLGRLVTSSNNDDVVVEIVLSCVKPLDDDDFEWSPHVCRWVHNELFERRVRVGVKFALGNTVWAERIVVTEKTNEKIWLTRFDLQKSLLERNLASPNEKHLKLLQFLISSIKNLCENGVKIEQICSSPTKLMLKFDSLPSSNDAAVDVVVTSVDTLNRFYVRKADRSTQLLEMENELTSKIKMNSLVSVKPSDVIAGLICTASFNGVWQRAIVFDSNRTTPCDVLVFFVDDGDYGICKKDSLFYLPDSFIGKLPALAIPCSLLIRSLSSPHDSKSLGDILWESTRDDESNEGLILSAEVVGVLQTKNNFGPAVTYKIHLKTRNGDDVSSSIVDSQPSCQNVSNVSFFEEQTVSKLNDCVDIVGDWKPLFGEKLNKKQKKKFKTVANLSNLSIKVDADEDEKNSQLQNEIVLNLVSELIQKVALNFTGLPKLKRIEQKWKFCSTAWIQTEDKIRLTLMLNDVKTFNLRVSDRKFYFSTMLPTGEFKLMLTFFSFVLPSSTSYKIFGNRITFHLKKILHAEWPRLIDAAEKLPYLRFDYGSFDEETGASAETKEVKRLIDHKNIFNLVRDQIPEKEKYNCELIGDGLPPEEIAGLIPHVPRSDDEGDDASSLDSADENFQTDKTFGFV